jgi:hypothetical protein
MQIVSTNGHFIALETDICLQFSALAKPLWLFSEVFYSCCSADCSIFHGETRLQCSKLQVNSNFPSESMVDFMTIFTDMQNLTSAVGCPVSEQPWCADTPAMTIPQVLIGYLFTCVGYPIGVTVIFSLFSKILGPRPQVRLIFINFRLFMQPTGQD